MQKPKKTISKVPANERIVGAGGNELLMLAADFLSGKEFRFHKGEFRRYRLKGKPGDGWLESANNNGDNEYMYCFVSAVTNEGFYYRDFESEIAGKRTPHILPNDKFQPFSSLQVCR